MLISMTLFNMSIWRINKNFVTTFFSLHYHLITKLPKSYHNSIFISTFYKLTATIPNLMHSILTFIFSSYVIQTADTQRCHQPKCFCWL